MVKLIIIIVHTFLCLGGGIQPYKNYIKLSEQAMRSVKLRKSKS